MDTIMQKTISDTYEIVVCKMVVILSRGKWVNAIFNKEPSHMKAWYDYHYL